MKTRGAGLQENRSWRSRVDTATSGLAWLVARSGSRPAPSGGYGVCRFLAV